MMPAEATATTVVKAKAVKNLIVTVNKKLKAIRKWMR
jgi:hypothetical protein